MSERQTGFVSTVGKASLASVACAAVFVFLFSVLLKFVPLTDGAILPVNQILKGLSVFLGCMFFVRGERGYLQGLVVGLITASLTFLLFSLLLGGQSVTWKLLLDLVFGGLVGLLSGIVAVNVKR